MCTVAVFSPSKLSPCSSPKTSFCKVRLPRTPPRASGLIRSSNDDVSISLCSPTSRLSPCSSPTTTTPFSKLRLPKTPPRPSNLNRSLNDDVSAPTTSFGEFRLQKPPQLSSSVRSSSDDVLAPLPSSSPTFSKTRLAKPSNLVRSCNDDVLCSATSSETLSKRKRPARLSIPLMRLSEMTVAAAEEEEEDDLWREREVDGEGYAVYCKRGKREKMDDRFMVVAEDNEANGKSKQAFFGVYDGHGGAKAAEFAAENLYKNIVDEVDRRGEGEIEVAVKHGYLNTDRDFLKQDLRGGSCCVTALVQEDKLVVSNAGDCRAVMSREGIAEALTSDHRPSRLDEKQRIEALGGYVDCSRGVSRILGSLAVSRSIGDRSLKQWVTAEPETRITTIAPELEFLILASDGLWDKVSNQEAVDIARTFCISTDKPDGLIACKKLVNLSISRGSIDDVTVMIIQLGQTYQRNRR